MRNNGFTLLELSIVIVIIGLIVAGISAGQSLVQQASLRQITSDINKFNVAINSFKLQYDAIPGDMINAQSYWSTAFAEGNGDSSLNSANEYTGFWQHLTLAGILDGTYTGDPATAPNKPEAALSGAGHRALNTGSTLYGRVGNRITLEGYANPALGVIQAKDAYALDVKMDDGDADSGMVYSTTPDAVAGSATQCTTGSWIPTSASASYNLDVTANLCRMIFWLEK